MMRTRSFLLFSLVFLLTIAFPPAVVHAAKAWEGTLTIPTYPWEEDINPKFFALENSIIYPYTMQDRLSTQKVDRVYKALFLENEYLRVTCVPALAGRIFSVFDKTTGEEMFHKNPVVKPGMIAMRGAWISGGIEWNTGPHGHSVTIVSPVNATTQSNDDGSVSLVISNTEKIFRTRWTVHVTLHPGRSYLDERIRIFNPTDHVHPYYFWNCTAFYCLPGTRFIYPMTLGTDHSGTRFYHWPVDKGKDLSWLKNYDRPSSVFAYNCVFDFFGAYDVDLDRGIVQYADHNMLIGKKAWTWGQSGDGIVSQRNLHEGDEQYIEVQSGPLLTQADYGLLHPREAVQWQEWWYPVHGLGDGFEYATREVAIQRLVRNDKVEFRVIPTARFNRSRITIRQGDNILFQQKVNLSPRQATVIETDLPGDGDCDLVITDHDNKVLASYHSPLPIPEQEPPQPDWKTTKPEEELSAEELYLKALLYDKQTNRQAAREGYQKALQADPGHVPSLKGLAVLNMEAGLFEKAIPLLKTALERDADDGMAWFYLGSSYVCTSRLDEALDCAYKSVTALSTAALGYDLAGRIHMRRGHYPEALRAFEQSVSHNGEDERARNHLLIAHYACEHDKVAEDLATQAALADPTDPVPVAVLWFLRKQRNHVWNSLYESLGEKEFEIIEAGLVFANLGLYKEASHILHAFTSSPAHASSLSFMPYYYLAYWAHQLQQDEEVKEYLAQAESNLRQGIFPSRLEAIPVLRLAVKEAPKKRIQPANACLHLGNVLAGLGRLKEAKDQWQRAVDLNPTLNIAWRNLGLLAWKRDQNLDTAIKDYRNALEHNPHDQTLYRDLASILIQNHQRPQAITLLKTMPPFDQARTDIIEILARAYVDEKQYTQAIQLLDGSFFSNWENRTMSRNVFVQAHIERGKQYMHNGQVQKALADFSTALTYPDNLGVGRPARPAEAEPLYWKGRALRALGKIDEAKNAWRQGMNSAPKSFADRCRNAIVELH